jgi:hypothetical protein
VRTIWILFTPLVAAGCAMPPTVVQGPPPVMMAAVLPTKLVETRYEVRSYREAANPSLRHEAHAVFRCTRVPITASDALETVPRTSYPPASVTPLPASAELAAELSTQKKLTAELRTAQTSVAEIEQKMQAQYAQLVRQSAEALRLREQLESEHWRIQDMVTVESAPAASTVTPTSNPTVKW